MKKEEEESKYEASTIAAKSDLQLQYIGQEAELSNIDYNLVIITRFIATATTSEPELELVLQSQERIFQRYLYTLTTTSNYKDILKQQASPKVKAAYQ